MASSGPISSWQIDGGEMEIVTDFIFLDSKITVDGDCSHKIKRCLLLERKAERHHFANKGSYSQSYGFPAVMYGCESWTIKKAETIEKNCGAQEDS